jgi:hypothetical protein
VNHGKKDPRTTVFATELAAVAVFHALSRTVKRTCPELRRAKHGFSVDKGQITLYAEPEFLTRVKRLSQLSNVYLLDRKAFVRKSEMEWQARKSVAPLGVFFVQGRDLAGFEGPGVTLKTID